MSHLEPVHWTALAICALVLSYFVGDFIAYMRSDDEQI